MKLPSLLTRKTLRATAARRSLGVPDEMDYEEMSEPNMKLSRALLIVLVLHVVAVAGIIAFNTIKSRQGPLPVILKTNPAAPQTTVAKTTAPPVATSDSTASQREEASSKAATKPVAKEERKAIPVKQSAESPATKSDKKTYVVAKGDNPVAIARKFKIPYDDLLAANKIEDPHKLRVGQKLIIPAKPPKPKKTD
jgi:nucleoid-associated protein YgaU